MIDFIDSNHLVEGLCLLFIINFEKNAQFVVPSACPVDYRLHIYSFSVESLQEIHHLGLLFPLIDWWTLFAFLLS